MRDAQDGSVGLPEPQPASGSRPAESAGPPH